MVNVFAFVIQQYCIVANLRDSHSTVTTMDIGRREEI